MTMPLSKCKHRMMVMKMSSLRRFAKHFLTFWNPTWETYQIILRMSPSLVTKKLFSPIISRNKSISLHSKANSSIISPKPCWAQVNFKDSVTMHSFKTQSTITTFFIRSLEGRVKKAVMTEMSVTAQQQRIKQNVRLINKQYKGCICWRKD